MSTTTASHPTTATRKRGPEPATARLDVRLAPKDKKQIVQAAAESGESTAAFVLQAIRHEIARRERERYVLDLSERDQVAFTKALLAPAKPNAALVAAAQTYRQEFRLESVA